MSDMVFKQCPGCGVTWQKRKDFLEDPEVSLIEYTVNFEELILGLFHFNHVCGTSLFFQAEKFMDLYDGHVFQERQTDRQGCPGYCLYQYELRPCPEACECASVREVVHMIQQPQHRWSMRQSDTACTTE